MKNAAIYTANPKQLSCSVLASTGGFRNLRSDAKDAPSVIEGGIGENRFRLNVMPEAEVKPHLDGFRAYINSYHDVNRLDNLKELLEYVDSICCVYGLVLESEFDFGSDTWQGIKRIAELVDGVIFVCDSLIDTDDMVVFGPLGED